jgi:DNA-binding XRE family transcriptional regulator
MALKSAQNGSGTMEPERGLENDEQETALSPHNIVDTVAFGRRLRSLRILHGFDRMEDFANILRSRYGIDLSARSIYAIERGEQMPHLDLVLASVALLDADPIYFFPAIRPDVVEAMTKKANQ